MNRTFALCAALCVTAAIIVFSCDKGSVEPGRLVGTWHLTHFDAGDGRVPAQTYNIHRFFDDNTLQILDAEKRPFVIEGDTIFVISRSGVKSAFEKIVSLSENELVLSDAKESATKMYFANITNYSTSIIGEWRLKSVVRDGAIVEPSAINMNSDLIRIFGDDGEYWEIKDGIKSGPFPFTVSGIFAEIELGQGKTDYFEIHLLTDTTLERNLVPGKTTLRTVYEKIPAGTAPASNAASVQAPGTAPAASPGQ
jgi:hypothetical protein